MRPRIILHVTALLGLLTPATASAEYHMCGRSFSTIEDLHITLKGELRANLSPDKNFVAYLNEDRSVIWTFATKKHPSYPSVACRMPEKTGDKIELHTSVICEADRKACDELQDAYRRSDEAMKQSMRDNK